MKYVKAQITSPTPEYMEIHDGYVKIDYPNQVSFQAEALGDRNQATRRFVVSCSPIGVIAQAKTPGGCEVVFNLLVGTDNMIVNFNDDRIQEMIENADKKWASEYNDYMDIPADVRVGMSVKTYQKLTKNDKPKSTSSAKAKQDAAKEAVKKQAEGQARKRARANKRAEPKSESPVKTPEASVEPVEEKGEE